MLEYNRIDNMNELIWVESIVCIECTIYHYCYLLKVNFKFQKIVCNGFHDIMQEAVNLNDAAVVKSNDWRIHHWYVSKDEAMNLLRNVDLTEKSKTL